MTRLGQEVRALRRQRIRRIRRIRRLIFMVMAVILLILAIYGIAETMRTGRLQKRVNQLEKQIKQNASEEKNLKKQLEDLKKQLQEKEKQLQRNAEANRDDPDKPNVYLTFDDGPSSNTDVILDTLAKYNVRATFFCIAKTGEESTVRYQRIVNEGHTLGMHSYSHIYKTVYANLASFEEDVIKISDYLYQETGVRAKYYRFPGGSSNTVSKVDMKNCIRYLNESHIKYFDWNAQNDDATGKKYTAAQLCSHALSAVSRAGNHVVLLMHDGENKQATAKSLSGLIKGLKKAGYDILPITDETEVVQHVRFDSVS